MLLAAAAVERWVEMLVYALLAGLLYFPARVYGRAALALRRGEGKVPTPYGIADLPLVFVLAGWLGLMVLGALLNPAAPREITQKALLENVALFSVIGLGILFFLQARKINAWAAFGLGKVRMGRVLRSGAGYLLAAYPLVLLGNLLMIQWLGADAQRQEVIDFFARAAEDGNRRHLLGVVLMAAIAAPVLEELLFRGYFYGVLRRFGGPWLAMLLCSALFAVIHGNLLATPGLFLLALCLTLAYERTGSLLVPMAMHAMFNSATLVLVYLSARAAPSFPPLP